MVDKIIELDKTLMIFFNKNVSNSLFDVFMPTITSKNFLTVIGLILIFYLVVFCGKKGRIAILVLIFAAGASDAICAQIIKPWIGRMRPSHDFIEYINLLVSKGGKWSFPSNHAANSFAFATVLSYFYERKKIILFLSASLIAYSRVYVGVHYPLDIVFGALIGYILSWIVLSVWVIVKMRELKRGRMWVWYANNNPPTI
tara:strand:+ start:164 stop:763 length:600 start_codon:yes stop_codon:yes gene_type:complete